MNVSIATGAALVVAASLATAFRHRPIRRPARTFDAPTPATPQRRLLRGIRRAPTAVGPAALAAWADDLSRALRHGATLHSTLAHTMPADPVIEARSVALRHWLDRGSTVAEACDEWSAELAHESATSGGRGRRGDGIEMLTTMAAVLAATATLGGAAAGPLDRYAVTMRQRASDDLERAAQSAQAQMSAKVLTSVPLAVLALLVLTDADVRAVIASASGGSVVALGLALNAAGALWMRRITVGGHRGRPC